MERTIKIRNKSYDIDLLMAGDEVRIRKLSKAEVHQITHSAIGYVPAMDHCLGKIMRLSYVNKEDEEFHNVGPTIVGWCKGHSMGWTWPIWAVDKNSLEKVLKTRIVVQSKINFNK